MKPILSLVFVLTSAASLQFAAVAAAPEPTRYQVKVTDTAGQPVSGAVIELYRGPDSPLSVDWDLHPGGRNTTDTNGAALFTVTNAAVTMLVASKPGLSLAWTMCYAGIPELDPGENGVVLMLTPPATVAGVVQDAAGKPVADAQVWVNFAFRPANSGNRMESAHFLNPQEGRQYLAARTGSDGKFRIEKLPADATLELGAAKPGLALDQPTKAPFDPSNLGLRAGESNIVLTLKPAASVEGMVVQAGTGAPLAGARVMAADALFGGGVQPSLPTGPDGRFRLADLSPGQQRLRALIGTNSYPDWVCEPVTVQLEAGATNREMKITASRGGVVEITVHDKAGDQPVAKASIILVHEGGSEGSSSGESATTSEQGLARLRVVPGSYFLLVSKSGLGSHQSQLTVEGDQTNQVAITLESAPKLTGTVLGSDGKPAPGIAVSSVPFGGGERQTDAQGRFTLVSDQNRFGNQQQQERFLVARDPARNLAAALPLEEDATNATLRLEAGLILGGRVADAKGRPITNAAAVLIFRTERSGNPLGQPLPVDAQGRFEFKGLPRSHPYQVNVTAQGFGQDTHDLAAEDAAGPRADLAPFELVPADQRIAGVVLDADGQPVAGAWVNAYGGKQPQSNGKTDAKGRFALDHVCPGPINLSANTPRGGAYGSTTAEGGDTNITIQLGVSMSFAGSGSGKFSGTVTGPDGKPAAKVAVRLFPFNGAERPSDAEGRFKLTFNPQEWGGVQQYQRVLIARDLARDLAVALEVEPDATNADLKLEPALTLSGRVTSTDGKAITNADVSVMLNTRNIGSSIGPNFRSGAEGRFEVKGLPTGRRYTVTVSANGFGQDNLSVEPSETATHLELAPIQLLVADQRIAGVVLDDDDKPVSGANLSCYENKQPNLNGQTDTKGHFHFDKVCAGTINLSVNSPRGGYANVTAEAGDTNITVRVSSTPGRRSPGPRPVSLKGKPLPDLAPLGLAAADCPAGQPVLALLIDAEQRPSRRALRLLSDQAAALKQKGVAVIILQFGSMAEDAFADWKKDAAVPFPTGCVKSNPDQARAAWGAAALPWLILADKTHRVAAEGFAPEELDAKLDALGK